MSEEIQIIKECLEGNVESFNYLVLKYQNPLLRTAYRFLNNWDKDSNAKNTLAKLAEEEFLQKAINQLPVKRRRTFILVELEGFSSVEAAEILGCSESTVRVTLMKAREQLRKIYLELNGL